MKKLITRENGKLLRQDICGELTLICIIGKTFEDLPAVVLPAFVLGGGLAGHGMNDLIVNARIIRVAGEQLQLLSRQTSVQR